MRITIAVAFLVLTSGAVLAQGTEACLKATQPKVDAFNACAKPKVEALGKGDQPAKSIIDTVFSDCDEEVEALRALLQIDPCNQNDVQTNEVMAGWRAQAVDDMTVHLKKLRGN